MSIHPNEHPGAGTPEQILREGRANHQRGRETVGGRMQLTDRALRFIPHGLNLQTGASALRLAEVTGVRPAWTRAFGAVPIAPNSVIVSLADGSEQSFVLPQRRSWIADIERAARSAGARLP